MDSQARAELADFCTAQHGRLVGTLTLYCGDAGVAAELAQETLVRACSRWGELRRMESPGAWVNRVAINLCNSHYRRRRAELSATARYGGRRDDRGGGTETAADVVAIRGAVSSLPPRQRTALVLRYYGDLSVEQTADAMKCRPGTVKSLTSQALAALRTMGLTDTQEPSHA